MNCIQAPFNSASDISLIHSPVMLVATRVCLNFIVAIL